MVESVVLVDDAIIEIGVDGPIHLSPQSGMLDQEGSRVTEGCTQKIVHHMFDVKVLD